MGKSHVLNRSSRCSKRARRERHAVAAAQRVEHYEMAGYSSGPEFAQLLGQQEMVALLDATLAEEKTADKKLREPKKRGGRHGHHESETANDGGSQISQSFCGPSPLEKLLFMFGDGIYVFSNMIGNLRCYPCAAFCTGQLDDWLAAQDGNERVSGCFEKINKGFAAV